MTKATVEVTVDIREPPEVATAVDAHADVASYSYAEMDSADIEIAGVGFERKTCLNT